MTSAMTNPVLVKVLGKSTIHRIMRFSLPTGIAGPHSPNEVDELAIRGGAPTAGPGFPTPEQTKTQPMPGDDRLGLEEGQAFLPVRPEPPQGEPQ